MVQSNPRILLKYVSSPLQESVALFEALVQCSLNWSAKSHPWYLLKPQILGLWESDPIVLGRRLKIGNFKIQPLPPGNYYYSSLHRISVEDKITGFRATLPGSEPLLLHLSTLKSFPTLIWLGHQRLYSTVSHCNDLGVGTDMFIF